MPFTINKEYSESTMKAQRNSAKTSPKLTKTHVSSIYPEQTFVCRVDVQLVLKKKLGEIKRSIPRNFICRFFTYKVPCLY